MLITPNIQAINHGLWIISEHILIISDLHLGYEEQLTQKGIMVPKLQISEIISRLKDILSQVNPKIIIINGDLKHEFGRILRQEWKDALHLVNYLKQNCQELILIKGNHDKILGSIAEQNNVKIKDQYETEKYLITHGDKIIETPDNIKTIIIGHEHPAITLKEGSKIEKYKCFLKGKWKTPTLIVMPSFNPLIEGTDVIKEQLLSPYLKNNSLAEFEVFITNKNETFNFGKIKYLN